MSSDIILTLVFVVVLAAAAHPSSVTDLTQRARLAKKAGRYDDVIKAMKAAIQPGVDFNTEQRKLLFGAYEDKVEVERSSIQVLDWEAEDADRDPQYIKSIKTYRSVIEKELKELWSDVLSTIDELILFDSIEGEARVFYSKAKGDYLRYYAEVQKVGTPDRKKAITEADNAYRQASAAADESLGSAHPLNLAVKLAYSVFLFETKGDRHKAIKVARNALDNGILRLDAMKKGEDLRKDSAMILQQLHDQLILWRSVE